MDESEEDDTDNEESDGDFIFDDEPDEESDEPDDEDGGFVFEDEETDNEDEFTFEDEVKKEPSKGISDKVNMVTEAAKQAIAEGKPKSEIQELTEQVKALSNELRKLNGGSSIENDRESKLRKLRQLQKLRSEKGTSKTNVDKNKNYKKDEKEDALRKDYDRLTIDEVYKDVREFLIKNGVRQHPVDVSLLVEEFGTKVVRELLHKSYIIKIGKGVSIGK